MNRRRRACVAVILSVVLCGCTVTPAIDAHDVSSLAPSGALRVAVYRGSPSSVLIDPVTGDMRGVGHDLGESLAARLGVPFAPIVFASNAEALAAIRKGAADVTFTNASPARARDMDFSPAFMDVAKSFLVPATSTLRRIDDLQRPGLLIGVSAGSTTASELAPDYPGAVLVTTPTLAAALMMLADDRLDAFATNKGILFQMSDALPGSHVLDGQWGIEHFAAAIPKGRAGSGAVAAFIEDAVRDGTVQRAIDRAKLRGAVRSALPTR